MEPTVRAVLAILMRWIHIASVVTLIGGFIYARYALAPALAALPDAEQKTFGWRVIANFHPLMYTGLVTILGSGLYNYLTKALHIFSVAILYSLPGADQAKRNRWLTGIVISGLIVIAISGYLRWISMP